MKNINKAVLLGLATLASSCITDLDPNVYSNLTSTNAFQTKADAIAAVNAVYGRLKAPSVGDSWQYWATRHFALTDLTTDVGHSSGAGELSQLSNCVWNSANGLLAQEWQTPYKLISNANNSIIGISSMTAITDAEKAQFLAEIKFLRALAYMDLTASFGPVILSTEAEVAAADYKAQPDPAPLDAIQQFLMSDLISAANVLPKNYEGKEIYNSVDKGRATKGAALTLLGKLYLRRHDWPKADDIFTQVIQLHEYSLYPSYNGLFKESNKWCKEFVFVVLSDEVRNATELRNHFGPSMHPVVTDRWQLYAASWYFYNSFANNDERKQGFYAEYVDIKGVTRKQAPVAAAPGATPPAGEYYMADVAIKKYADEGGSASYYDGITVTILRYADVLLSKAEALNEMNGPTEEAIELINQVKRRSKATPLVLRGQTKESLRDALIQERGWEFFYEGKRREDLVRMGKYDAVVNRYLAAIGKPPAIVMPKHKYFTYPLDQINVNPKLSNADRE